MIEKALKRQKKNQFPAHNPKAVGSSPASATREKPFVVCIIKSFIFQ